MNGVNAVQTYAAGRSSGSINSVTAHCLRGDFRDTSGACEGRIAMPAADPSVGAIGGTENLDAMPILSTVTVNTPMEVTSADFGVYAAGTGSWGDAAFSSTAAQQGPRLYDYDPDSTLRLGDTRGEFTDGSTTNNHATDDGVAIAGPNGRIALQDNTTILAVGNEYDVIGNLQGDAAGNAQLSAWLAATNSPSDFRTNSTSTTGQAGSAAQKYLYAGADDAVATLQVPTSPDPAGGLSSTWLRAVATDADSITEPDNTNGQYQPAQGSAAANTTPWVNRGEIEDYRVSIANAVIRVAATTLNEVADGDFGYQLTGPISTTAPSANSVTFRPSLSNALTYSPVSHAVSNVGQDVSVANNTIPELVPGRREGRRHEDRCRGARFLGEPEHPPGLDPGFGDHAWQRPDGRVHLLVRCRRQPVLLDSGAAAGHRGRHAGGCGHRHHQRLARRADGRCRRLLLRARGRAGLGRHRSR